jgi:hypothetical protein
VNIEAVVVRLDLCAEGVALFSMTLSEDERSRAGRFARERDRRRYVVARGRLRKLLAQRLGADPREIELVHGANGKPALAQRFKVSVGTIRRAVSDLVAENVLVRRQGSGTYVATHTPDYRASATRWHRRWEGATGCRTAH